MKGATRVQLILWKNGWNRPADSGFHGALIEVDSTTAAPT